MPELKLDLLDQGQKPALSATSDAVVVEAAPAAEETAEVTETTVAETETGKTDGEESATEHDQTKKPPKGVQKRLGELAGERDKAREEAEANAARAAQLERELQEARQRLEEAAKPVQQEELKPPKKEDFEDPDAYVEALVEYKAEAKLREADQKRRQESVQQAVVQQESALNARWKSKVEEVKAEFPDYEEVTNRDDIQVSFDMVNAMRMVDNGPAIAYHLAKNPELASRLSTLPRDAAILEIGQISAQLKVPAKKPVSKTPAPITPVGGKGEATFNPDNASMDDYVRHRQEANGGKPIR